MKQNHSQSEDSDDEVDNLPLKYVSTDHKIQTMKELKSYSVHACDFCEKSFTNRYNYLIHNAKHIIIPLMKMLPQNCVECGLFCISQEEFNEHISTKHNNIVKSQHISSDYSKTKIKEKIKFEDDEIEEINEDEQPLKYLKREVKEAVENEEGISTEGILENFMMNCKVDVEKFEPWISQTDDCETTDIINGCKNEYKISLAEFEASMKHNSVEEIHEASPESKVDLNCFTYNNLIKNELDSFNSSDADSSSDFSDLDDPIVILAPVKKEIDTELKHDSVHFDDLMKPGIYYCKRCFKRFPNRFEVITHEAIHLDLSKAALNSYKDKAKHKTKVDTNLFPPGTSNFVNECIRCNELVSDEKLHSKSCFKMYCPACAKGFNNKYKLIAHQENCNGEAVVNMCDSCLYLKDKPKHIQYNGIMRCDEQDVKRRCHWCNQLCDYVSLVTIISKKTFKDRIKFEGEEKDVKVKNNVTKKEHKKTIAELKKIKKQMKKNRLKEKIIEKELRKKERARRKMLSKWDRLKLIQNRLKLMKK